jgi:hypothetical protein
LKNNYQIRCMDTLRGTARRAKLYINNGTLNYFSLFFDPNIGNHPYEGNIWCQLAEQNDYINSGIPQLPRLLKELALRSRQRQRPRYPLILDSKLLKVTGYIRPVQGSITYGVMGCYLCVHRVDIITKVLLN